MSEAFVEVRLSSALYAREDVQAAALSLGARARVTLRAGGGWLVARLLPADGEDARALEGDLLNEALAHRCRQMTAGLLGPLAQAVEASVRTEGFPPPSPDPLEELEPDVSRDRRQDLERLRREAGRLKPL